MRYLAMILFVVGCKTSVPRDGDARLCDALASSHATEKALLDQVQVEYAAVGRALKTWEAGKANPPANDTGTYSGALQRAYGYKAAAEAFCESANVVTAQMRALGRGLQTDAVRSVATDLPDVDCHLKAQLMSSSPDASAAVQAEWSASRNNALDAQKPLLDACVAQFGTKPASPPMYKILTLIDD